MHHMDFVSMMIGAVVGAALGAAGLFVWHLKCVARVSEEAAGLRTRNDVLSEQSTCLAEEASTARQDTAEMSARREEAEKQAERLTERLRERDRQFAEQQKILEEAKTALTDAFKVHSAVALKDNREQFMTQAEERLKPIKELLEKHNVAVSDIEKKREVAYKGLEEQIKFIATANEKLTSETGRLVSALRRPEQRGRWGEMQLRNVVELAGMTEHCDFCEQAQTDDPSTRDRPDMIVRLPGDAVIVVDSKVSLDAYLNSIQPDCDRAAELQRHARQVENHVRKLASTTYWNQFERTPKLVVMFMPLESALMASLEVKPDLHADAMRQNVLIATPTLLVATLRAIAYGWQQEAIALNARQIAATASELYDRLRTFTEHFTRIGKGLEAANKCYNAAVGSLERNLLPGARKMRDLQATTDGEIEAPLQIEIDVRDITAPELRTLPDA
jgi:DNA recombination protein RmuC